MFKKKDGPKDELVSNIYNGPANLSPELTYKMNEHKKICDFIHNLYVTKNRDYGDSMHPLYEEYGLTAFLVLFGIKTSRIKSLMQKGIAKYESLEDSLMDLANYALMAITEIRCEKQQQSPEEKPKDKSLGESLAGSNAITYVDKNDMYRREN